MVGYRFLEEHDYEIGCSKKETANKPAFEIVELYIDQVVDHFHPLFNKFNLISLFLGCFINLYKRVKLLISELYLFYIESN